MNKARAKTIEDIYELSPMQQGMLFHTLYNPESGVYVTQFTFRLNGPLNVGAFKQAWVEVVARHPVLRTFFVWERRQKPLQIVRRKVSLPWISYDWRGRPEQEKQLETLLMNDREQGFSLREAPLMRFYLIRLAEKTYQFVWSVHHLLSDGWSTTLILKEVWAFYKAAEQRQRLYLESPRPYGDYMVWLAQQDYQKAERYWRQALQGVTAPTPFMVDLESQVYERASSPPQGWGGAGGREGPYSEHHFYFSPTVTDALSQMARQNRLTIATLLQGAWGLLLSRYSGMQDVVFGTTVSGRPPQLRGVESMVGLFINTLPVRVHIPTAQTGQAIMPLLSWLQQLQQEQLEREQYAYTPLIDIQGWSDVPRGTPLFESLLVFENYPVTKESYAGAGLQITDVYSVEQSNYPLTVVAAILTEREEGAQLWLAMNYDTSRFEHETIRRMAGHFQTLLGAMLTWQGIVANPDQDFTYLPLLTEVEKQQLLIQWNETQADYPSDKCIHQLFEEHAAAEGTPEAIAVIFGAQQLTYRELNARANQLAHYLIQQGVGPEVLVGICIERSLEMVVGLLAILKAGGAYLPLDPTLPSERLHFMLEDAQISLLLTHSKLRSMFPLVETNICIDQSFQLIQAHDSNPRNDLRPDNLAYLIYTSGSTGSPKGVLVEHQGLCNSIVSDMRTFGMEPGARIPHLVSFGFDAATSHLFMALCAGATVILCRMNCDLTSLLKDEAITHAILPVSMLAALPYIELPELKILGVGAEVCPPELVTRWGNGRRMFNIYGPTEATITTTIAECVADGQKPSLGRPIANVQVYILDHDLQPVPIGVPGELCIGGVGVARGYLNRPQLTAEKFIPNPFSPMGRVKVPRKASGCGARGRRGRLYKTGDLCRYLPDTQGAGSGNIEFLGRIDDQVKIRGFRIELGEIETVLRHHPSVQEAVVMVREEATEKRLVAYLVPKGHDMSSEPVSHRNMRSYLALKLPDVMIPSAFVQLEAIPLTPNGKIDRGALPEPPLRMPLLTPLRPRTPLETLLASIWQEVLDIQSVGVHDNFFELGGHSLLATQVVSRIRQMLQVELPLRRLFEFPTIAQLARRLSGKKPLPPIQPTQRKGDTPIKAPLSFAQERLWFLAQLEGASATYNMPVALGLSGQLDQDALEWSLNGINARHDVLRTTFIDHKGEAYQQISPSRHRLTEPLFKLSFINLDSFPSEQREAEVDRLATLEANQPFDLAKGPLWRVSLLRLSEERHVLLLTMHHIISDGWSMGILIRELSALYQAYIQGATLPPLRTPLSELEIQYADFALWQRAHIGAILEEQLAYWKEQLADAPPLLNLPTDHARPAEMGYQGAHYVFALPLELTLKLKKLSRQAGTTLFMTLEAAFAVLLSRDSGSDDILIGTPIANRQQREIEDLIGFFVNTLVFRNDLSKNPSFRQLLKQIRQVALEAYQHQDLPFERLVLALQPERLTSHSPLFQVMFDLQNNPEESFELEGVTVTPMEVSYPIAKFDLSLSMQEKKEGLIGSWEYSTDLFERATIERMAGHFQVLLEAVVSNPELRVAHLPLLTEAERHQLLVEWNAITPPASSPTVRDTQADYPSDKCIHKLFEEQVERTPEAIAVIFPPSHVYLNQVTELGEQGGAQDQGGQQLTYRELNTRANQLAHYLIKQGVGADVLVGICVERSLEMVVGLLGILKAGGAYLPLDPAYPSERIHFMLKDANVTLLLTQESLTSQLPPIVPTLTLNQTCFKEEPEWNPITKVKGRHLAYSIYTSGSTGSPKGVMIEHHSLVNHSDAIREAYSLSNCDRVLQFAALSFDVAAEELFPSLLVGATVVLHPVERFTDWHSWSRFLGQEKLTVLNLPASYWHEWVAELTTIPSTLRLVVVGSEKVLPSRYNEWQKRVQIQWLHAYGLSEACITSTLYEPLVPTGHDMAQHDLPIGRPIANTQLYILDHNRKPVPIGVAGELHIGGAGVARGYLNRPQLTAEKFIPNPFGPGRLYKTGDLCRYLPDGNIEFLGRIDHQVKIRGFRIELGEIEAILSTHPSVQEVVMIVREEATSKRLVAYLVPKGHDMSSEPVSHENMRSYLAQKLPDYMIPSAFVQLEAMPLTPNGKIDRRALPAPDVKAVRELPLLPRTPFETSLAEIWQEVLGIESVGVHDNFFELGGDSILSIQIISRAKQAGLHLTPKQLFQHQTIAELATVATYNNGFLSKGAEQGVVTGLVPLTPIQQWFLEQKRVEPHHFNQSVLLEVEADISPMLLKQAVAQLLVHHDVLRLRFSIVTSFDSQTWQQTLVPAEHTVPFEVVDLSALSSEEQLTTLESKANQLQASLNLSEGPLVRVALFISCPSAREASEALGTYTGHHPFRPVNKLLIVIHHLAVDGVSWRILLEDLQTAYQQLARGETIELPPKTTSFKEWATRINQKGPTVVANELEYWRSIGSTSGLPMDYQLGVNDMASAANISCVLSHSETQLLLSEVPAVYNTQINDLLLTALLLAFREWTGESSLLLDLEGHGREELFEGVDLSRTVGWFTTIFPVRLELESNTLNNTASPEPLGTSLARAIKSVKEQLRQIPNRGIGYGILRYLSPAQDPPVPSFLGTSLGGKSAQVSFNYFGQFDQMTNSPLLTGFASESTGLSHSPKGTRPYLLDINGMVIKGCLQVDWTYSQNYHKPETISQLANRFIDGLKALIAHCQEPEAGGYTPSDFPDVELSQGKLDQLLAEIATFHEEDWKNRVEAIYPLSPSQQGMLFETLSSPNSGIHIEQSVFSWHGDLNVAAFEQAWQRVIQRHSILRTGFVWQEEPLQFVLRKVKLPVETHSLREFDSKEQQEQLDRYISADRRRGFKLTRAPLMRLALFQTDENVHQIVWTQHHILTDGWSQPIVMKEVMAFYKAECSGQEQQLPPPRPYKNYMTWLREQDLAMSETFWRKRLQGFTWPTALATKAYFSAGYFSNDINRYADADAYLPPSVTANLRTLGEQHGLTMNTLIQASWALLLSCYSGQTDVLFGATVSGRPPEVVDVESMVGLFINTLPIRIKISPFVNDSLLSWLQAIQNQNLEQQSHSYCSAGQIHQWSEVPSSLPLYESLLVVENYPIDSSTSETNNQPSFELRDVRSYGAQTKYALTILVIPSELAFHIVYDKSRFEASHINQILTHLLTLLENITTGPQQPVSFFLLDFKRHQIPTVYPQPVGAQQTPLQAPRNSTELQLKHIWQEVLGRSVGVRDSFFDLGGHSLLAVRLMAQIQQHFAVNLPLATLFQSRTIEELASRLASYESQLAWSSLVPIRSKGNKPPFFCVPGVGGNVIYLYDLARLMGAEQPFYGLQAVGLDGESEPHTTVEEIAAHFIDQIQTVQPEGPYLLAGHSFGGWVIFEMALQLKEAGHEVAGLMMFDSSAPTSRTSLEEATWDEAKWLVSLSELISELTGQDIDLSYEVLLPLDPQEQLIRLKQELERIDILPAGSDLKQLRGLLQIFKTNNLMDYVPRVGACTPLRSPITLFRTLDSAPRLRGESGNEETNEQEVPQSTLGWNELTDGPIEIINVPGSHVTMMAQPHVQVLAKELSACLERAV